MFDDFRSCYGRLQFFDNLIDQICQIVGSGKQLTGVERSEAQLLLKELKKELKKDHDFMSNVNVKETLSDIDGYFYYPTVSKVLESIKIKTGSTPDQRWLRQLYEAQAEIGHCMEELENFL